MTLWFMVCRIALVELGIRTFHAKISLSNQPSIDLFTKKLGFYRVSESRAFQEVTLEWSLCPPPAQITSDTEDAYGAKATPAQRETIADVQKEVTSLWNNKIQKTQWQ